jgi:CubicO group peptidase (beta-lactamase class C family)
VRRAARQQAWRATARPAKSRTGGGHAAGTLASQAIAATGSVGCAAVFVCAGRDSGVLVSAYSAAGRSGRRGHAIGPDTRFEIGSVTKIFTGLILADMAVRKEVDPDAPLGSLLDIPAAGAVTLRSLATHTSGLPWNCAAPRLAALLTAPPNPYRDIGLDRVAAALARKPPQVPGTFRYSSVGYQLLAAALAAAASTTWPSLLQQRICGPLGMTATGMDPDENSARGHDTAGFPFPYSDYALLPGAIGLLSTTADLDRFLQIQLDPGEHATRAGDPAEPPPSSRIPAPGRTGLATQDLRCRHPGLARRLHQRVQCAAGGDRDPDGTARPGHPHQQPVRRRTPGSRPQGAGSDHAPSC